MASGSLWLLAKFTCMAQNPKCYECPIVGLCDYETKTVERMEWQPLCVRGVQIIFSFFFINCQKKL